MFWEFFTIIDYTENATIGLDGGGKMNGIFDLGRIKKLVGAEHPPAALIIDTGIVMDVPDLNQWRTSLDKPLFILPCLMQMELEHLKNNPERKNRACAASNELATLCLDGRIMEGIYKERIGWFIGAPLPSREPLEAELKQLDLIVKTFGQLTTRLIILARELRCDVPGIPSMILTRNPSLSHALQFMGINSVLFQGFPISDLEKTLSGGDTDTMKWDQILREIQVDAEKKLIQVEMSLLSRSVAPGWVNGSEQVKGHAPVLIAQGTGVIHAVTDIGFNWTLPYLAWDFPEINTTVNGLTEAGQYGNEKVGMLRPGVAYLDFSGADPVISPDLQKALINKIGSCASPMSYIEDMPTVQDPLAVIKQFLIFEFAFAERKHHGELNRGALDDFEDKLRNSEDLLNWAYYWLREREVDPEEVDVSLSEFLHAIRSCWNIGETLKFIMLDNPVEIGHIKEEAEG